MFLKIFKEQKLFFLQVAEIISINIFQLFVVLYHIQLQQLNQLVQLSVEQPFLDKMLDNVSMLGVVVDDDDGDDDDDVEIYQNHLNFL
jgi:hypothetical protein